MEDGDDVLSEYKNVDAGGLASSLGVEAMIGGELYRIGDSKIVVQIIVTGEKQESGRKQFREFTNSLMETAEKALPEMSKNYREFYETIIKDYKVNGINMLGFL